MNAAMRFVPVLIATAGLATAQHGAGRGGRMGGGFGAGTHAAHSAPARTSQAGPRTNSAAAAGLERNPALAQRLAPLVPAGMTPGQAASGFKNVGQFVAALHVSKNLGIPFTDLRSRMTGEDRVSLGKAVQELRPDLTKDQVRTAVRTAESDAKHP